jgi:D-alanyl-D-alanine carboxypeptidase
VFREVVQTRVYTTTEYEWANTNHLLAAGWKGIKTGVTKNAGPCFIGFWTNRHVEVIIVLLKCRAMEQRWHDAAKLLEEVLKQ